MHLAELTWTDAADYDPDVVVIPVGSTEQHGPHAPLATDVLTAQAVATAGVDAYDGTALITPTLPIGVSPEHRAFPGTLWLSPDTIRAVITDTVRSLAHHGWSRVVIANGHGGNTTALQEAAAHLTRTEPVYVTVFTWFDAVGDHAAEMGHAGPLETAMLQYHHPDLVHTDRLAAARDGGTDRWGEWVGRVNLAYDTDEFTENGVVGDPTTSTPDLGRELTTTAATALAELLAVVADHPTD